MKTKLFFLWLLIGMLMPQLSKAEMQSGTCGKDLTWTLEDGVLVVSGTGWMPEYEYSKAPWYSWRSTIYVVVIGEGISNIGSYAFFECSNLSSINLPKTITRIGKDSFRGCNSLTSIDIPNSVTDLGDAAFASSGLTSITIPQSVTSIPYNAFWYCKNLTSINIPEGVTSIDACAFGYTSLSSITIPNSVLNLGGSGFVGCSKLTSVAIGNSVPEINSETFQDCSSLTSITIPNSVTKIGAEAFKNCTSLTSITVPNSVTIIGDEAFGGCSGLTSINLPNSMRYFGIRAFRGCSGLTSVTFPNSDTYGENPFAGCSSVKELIYAEGSTTAHRAGTTNIEFVSIPNSITYIGVEAFKNCSKLTSINIPNSVTRIGSSAFENCTGLTSIDIPNSMTDIGERSFAGCKNMKTVAVLATIPPTVSNDFLSNAGTSHVHVYKGYGDIYKVKDGWNSYIIMDDIPLTLVTGIALDASVYQINISQKLTPQVVSYEPENATIKEVSWSSSDPSILTIVPSTGVCFGLKEGVATITATTKDGNATATAAVYVGIPIPEGIKNIKDSSSYLNYNIQGLRLSGVKKGLNIVNGNKVLVR